MPNNFLSFLPFKYHIKILWQKTTLQKKILGSKLDKPRKIVIDRILVFSRTYSVTKSSPTELLNN
jgi:hypothetical protein